MLDGAGRRGTFLVSVSWDDTTICEGEWKGEGAGRGSRRRLMLEVAASVSLL